MLEPIISTLKRWNELKVAKSLLDVFATKAMSFQEFDTLGKHYCEIKDYMSSIYWTEKALMVAPDNDSLFATRSNLSKVYNHANYPQNALDYTLINERMNPTDFEVLLEKAFSLFLLNRKAESRQILTQVLNVENLPDVVLDRVQFNLATHKMHSGQYKEGLCDFVNCGTTLDLWQTFNLPIKKWDGIPRPGATLVIYAKGGIGDELINARFCVDIVNMGMIPLWFTDRSELRDIFTRHGIQCISSLEAAPKDSLWSHAMSLPVVLNLEDTQLCRGNYLYTNPIYDDKWKHIIASLKIKVGLRWCGNMEYDHDLHRGLPILELYEEIKNPSCEYYSLQRDDGAEQTSMLSGVVDLQDQLMTFEDALSALNQLDVFVTSCTSLAHASAALGKRTIVLVPITEYYVWINDHWYGDNVTVIRQTVPRSWEQPISLLKQILDVELNIN
jgi:hypothetical protein